MATGNSSAVEMVSVGMEAGVEDNAPIQDPQTCNEKAARPTSVCTVPSH